MKVKCLHCKKIFEKQNSQIKRSPNNYCSRSCATSMNNRKNPRKQKTKKCLMCNTLIFKNLKYCKKHKYFMTDYELKDCIYIKHHKSSAFALVRARARAIAKKIGWHKCSICGYDKHIEIDHIKPISAFDINTKISIINDISNLRPLCPNCHWEVNHKK